MSTHATDAVRAKTRRSAIRAKTGRSARALAVLSLGPATVVAGIVWALVQPYRVTLFHPRGQGFWWLVAEPPLLVIVAGLLFHFFVARQLVADLEESDAASS